MVEHREIKLRFLAPGSHHGIVLGSFSSRDVRVGKIGNIEQEIALPFLRRRLVCLTSSAISSPICRTCSSIAEVSSPRPRAPPISLLNRFRSALHCWSAVSIFRRCASDLPALHRSWASSPPPRVANRPLTKSGCSRTRRISSMRRSYQRCPSTANRKPRMKARDFAAAQVAYISGVDELKLLRRRPWPGLPGRGKSLPRPSLLPAWRFISIGSCLSPQYQSLAVLGDPLILWIAGALYVLGVFRR